MRILTLIILAGCLFFSSCVSNKNRIYFQGLSSKEFIENPVNSYHLRTNDALSVIIKSPDPTATVPYVLKEGSGAGAGEAILLSSYIIDDEGNISIPTLGPVQVKGQTLAEAKQTIAEKVAQNLIDAVVDIKLVNFRVAVFGEVNRPGLLPVIGNQITIFQALSSAGDLTDFANRENIVLIRPKENGNEVVKIDLTKKGILSSPYYYLHPNDQLYVEPLRADTRRINLPLLSIVFSSISTTVLIVNVITR